MQSYPKHVISSKEKFKGKYCIYTYVSPGDEFKLEHLLSSLEASGTLNDEIEILVLGVQCLHNYGSILTSHNVHLIPCYADQNAEYYVKYSITDITDFEKYLFIDNSCIVMQNLAPLFDQIADNVICACSLSSSDEKLSSDFFIGSQGVCRKLSQVIFDNIGENDTETFNNAIAIVGDFCLLDQSYNWQFCNDILQFSYETNSITKILAGFDTRFMSNPRAIINHILRQDTDMAKRIFSGLQREDRIALCVFDNDAAICKERLRCILSIAMMQPGLLQFDTPKNAMGKAYFDTLAYNKTEIENAVLDVGDRRGISFLDAPIKVISLNDDKSVLRSFISGHCCGLQKHYNKYEPGGIKFIISTHKNYQTETLPVLLNSLINTSGIPASEILVVSGGWSRYTETVEDGVQYYNVCHNSFDYTGLIHIMANDIKSDYWFLMHDTCEVGSDFYNKVKSAVSNQAYDHISVDGRGFTNIGLYSWDFLVKSKVYIMSLLNCNKQRAMFAEQFLFRMGKSHTFGGSLEFIGVTDRYQTGTMRHILYYKDVDLYKFQLCADASLELCEI